MTRFSPLKPWLDRRETLRAFANIDTTAPDQESGGFLVLDVCVPFHEIDMLTPENLETSWNKTATYVSKSLSLISEESPGWLDRDDVEMILTDLGEPPSCCYSIYVVTVGTGDEERVVYVGKTSAKTARFGSGHQVATRLHAPQYDGLSKHLYQGCVTLLDEQDYLPLEWVHPITSAELILRSVEAQMIYELQPELNMHHRKKYNATFPIMLHIQNFSGISSFLHDHFLYPR